MTNLPAIAEPVHVAAAPHPFRAERVVAAVPAGLSIAEILEQVQPDPRLRRCAFVQLGGETVLREHWRLVRPKPGSDLTIRVVPQDGGRGQKNTLATVLSIAVLAASVVTGTSPALIGALGATGAGLVAAGIGATGPLVVTRPEPSR